ncbi:MAG: 30S ribosomal protein S16 [Flavobacteriales bacterium]|nr:30S ribosomal protein S16 [Flavobacteriales bacterium]
MATKLRLQRHGKKGKPFYHIVATDVRAKRDGRFIEKVGTYNPNTNPATIDIDFDRALYWVGVGAQPTDTCRAILSYKGVLYKNHLNKGVTKGALTQDAADKKFESWLADKDSKIQSKIDGLGKAAADKVAAQLATEKQQNQERAKALAAAMAPPADEPAAEGAEEQE